MKTLIISSSLSKNSRSFILCKEVQNELLSKKANVTFVDARNTLINAYHKNDTEDKKWLSKLVKENDNIERCLKRFKKKFDRTKKMKELRNRREFVKPSIQKREIMKSAVYRNAKSLNQD